jgi:hypothetical protein
MGEVADDIGDAFSSVYKSFESGSKEIGEALGYGLTSDKTKRRRRAALEASRPRRPANIDDARTRQQESDRLRRRQGVLGNIYAGASPTAPLAGSKVLLGS